LVIVPTHDRLEYLDEALESIAQQTRHPDQVIVTGNVGPGVLSDADLATRLNAAIEESDCDAFLILCDDDKLTPDFIEHTVSTMEERGVDIVYTNCYIFGDSECVAEALGQWKKENLERHTVPLVTSLCRKSAWRAAGGFRNVQFFDWDFWRRCCDAGATAYWLQAPLFQYRDHAGQQSKVSA
jgi:GT2 family glycosyltransferase